MKRSIIITFCMFLGLIALAQSPELTVEQHLEDYDFAVKYIEDNYAGYFDKVVDSTRTDYDAMKTRLRDQIATNGREGWNAFAEYTAWFNDDHLAVHRYYRDNSGNYIGWTEHFNTRKKCIHYESLMEYKPAPVACKVTDKTFLIRFPSCDGKPDGKWILNSVKQFKKSHCKNLVIDIRGNGGGNDEYWTPYWYLLYDHESLTPAPEYRNTPSNLAYVQEKGWRVIRYLKELATQHPDEEFLGYGFNKSSAKKVDKKVKKAAILIDNHVASSGESMVLALKACSDRVTVFGRDNTRGCLDYANVATIAFKNVGYTFQMPMSRIHDVAKNGIDATGIAPDVRIDLPLPARLTDNIDEWVIWVAEQLEQ